MGVIGGRISTHTAAIRLPIPTIDRTAPGHTDFTITTGVCTGTTIQAVIIKVATRPGTIRQPRATEHLTEAAVTDFSGCTDVAARAAMLSVTVCIATRIPANDLAITAAQFAGTADTHFARTT